MSTLEVFEGCGEQLSLLNESLVVTDGAIIDSNSCAVAGVRRFIFDREIGDIEIFERGNLAQNGLEVYPLDGRDLPVEISPLGYTLSDEYLKEIVTAVDVARAQGLVPSSR